MSKNLYGILSVLVAVVVLILSVFAITSGFDFSDDDGESKSSMSSSMSSSIAVSVEDATVQEIVLASDRTLVENAANIESVSTVFAAINAAGLSDALNAEGPFTAFLPSNEAFDKLPEGTVESLLQPENKDQLVALLQYHVVPGQVLAGELTDGQVISTLSGRNLTVNIDEGVVTLNGDTEGIVSMVVLPDLQASNGVVHVIDSVLTV